MTQGKFSKEEAKSCHEALDEVMKAFPKSKVGEFVGHFNDIFLFLDVCINEAPSEEKSEEEKSSGTHTIHNKDSVKGCGKYDKENPELTRSCGDILFSNEIWLCKSCKKKEEVGE